MTTTPIEEMDLSAGSYVKGVPVNDNTFFAVIPFKQLKVITRDPASLQPNSKQRANDPDLAELGEIHDLVQRALQGSKKTNVKSYKQYIADVVAGQVGVLPPIHLWSQNPLDAVQVGKTVYALVPTGEQLLSIDGETQLTAHYALAGDAALPAELKDAHQKHNLGVVVHHGIETRTARQYFHDLNVLAVRPNTSLGLSMDTSDPLMQVVDEVQALSVLVGRVDTAARQLSKRSPKIVTLQALRQMVVNIAKGISGIQYGARPAPVDDVDLKALKEISVALVGGYFDRFGAEIADRDNSLAGSGPVLAAVGAMGNEILRAPDGDRDQMLQQAFDRLKEVDWLKGDHWVGIAGNYTSNQVFSTKGTKEVAYAVHTALTETTSAAYHKVRHLSI